MVYYPFRQATNLGGPGGYLAKLRVGLEAIGASSAAYFLDATGFAPKASPGARLRALIGRASALWRGAEAKTLAKAECVADRAARVLDALDFDAVLCHELADVLLFDRYLARSGRRVPVGLMSHCPEIPSCEKYAEVLARDGLEAARRAEAKTRVIERQAFERADFYVFPSPEAMEPYASLRPLMEGKPVLFMASGCERLGTALTREAARAKFGVRTPHVVAYIGRHNAIKGYDLMQAAAREILSKRDDVTFLIAGKPSALFPPPDHPRWVELGWADAAEVFRAADVFCLPNRQTYYDLVLLETLSCGSVVLASATGGNTSVHRETNGAIALFEGEAALAPALERLLDLPEAERDASSRSSRK